MLASPLDHLIGVGEIRRASLLKRFATIESVFLASDDELRAAGLSPKTIEDLRAKTPRDLAKG